MKLYTRFNVPILQDGPWPSVMCICPTYGRFERLRDAIACFLLQDYAGDKCLSILNDAEMPLTLMAGQPLQAQFDQHTTIVIRNEPHFPTLGRKKQSLADAVTTDLISHWEDDDLYLPWHLSLLASVLRHNPDLYCAKPHTAWRLTGSLANPGNCYYVTGRYDGQMLFRRGTAVPYLDATRRIELPLLFHFWVNGRAFSWFQTLDQTSYVYRIDDGTRHLCRSGSSINRSRRGWEIKNSDFGNQVPLIPDGDIIEWARLQLRPILSYLVDRVVPNFGKDVSLALASRLASILGDQS